MDRDPGDENLARIAGLPFEEVDQVVAAFTTRQRTAAAAWAYEALRENWRVRGTYRALLDLLAIDGDREIDSYRLLMAAGDLDLDNALPADDRPSRAE